MKKYNKQILEAINRGIKLALDNYEDTEIKGMKTGQIGDKSSQTKDILDFFINSFVDLGLPSGTLWSKYNLGVDPKKLNNEEDWYGDYYAWAEVNTKDLYTEDNYKYSEPYKGNVNYLIGSNAYTKYNRKDNKTQLDLEDDAAYINNPFKDFKNIFTPTADQFDELLENTIHGKETEQKDYLGVRGLCGRLFKSKINGKEIFFPYSGIKNGAGELELCSHKGYFMCSYIYPQQYDYLGWALDIDDHGYCGVDTITRRFGLSVRPIMKKK